MFNTCIHYKKEIMKAKK